MKIYQIILLSAIILFNSTITKAQGNLTINLSIFPCENNLDSTNLICENLVTNKTYNIKGKKKSLKVGNDLSVYISYEILFLLQSKYRITFTKAGCNETTFYLNTAMPKSDERKYGLDITSGINTLRDSLRETSGDHSIYYCWYIKKKKGFDTFFEPKLINEMMYNIGVEKSEKNEFEDAILDFTEALEFVPNDVGALYNRGVVKFKLNDNKGACEDWNRVKLFGSDDADELLKKYCN